MISIRVLVKKIDVSPRRRDFKKKTRPVPESFFFDKPSEKGV